MKPKLEVFFESYIPDNMIQDFEQSKLKKHFEIEINKAQSETYAYGDLNEIIYNIKIYVNENLIELSVLTIGYLLKSGVKSLWTSLSKISPKIRTVDEITDIPKNILVEFTGKDKKVKINFSGGVDDEQATKIIDKCLEFISTEQVKDLADNSITKNNNDKSVINLMYNDEQEIWEVKL